MDNVFQFFRHLVDDPNNVWQPSDDDDDPNNIHERVDAAAEAANAFVEHTNQMAQQQQHNIESSIKPPPASQRAIQELPSIQVAPEDLVDENNRECCICLEPNKLKKVVIRLPCAHIFHPQCITSWLERNCTCPVCRYELETSDSEYEVGRQERMLLYKKRFARYELERMTTKQLKQLAVVELKLTNTQGLLERQDWMDAIVGSSKIDIIEAPEPVEYPLSLLQAMSVSELKRCMEHAGVFFDARTDIVEKKDMIALFVRSGRLVLLPEEEQEEKESKEGCFENHDESDNELNRDCSCQDSKKQKVVVETVTESDDDASQEPRSWSSTSVLEVNEEFCEPPPASTKSRNTRGVNDPLSDGAEDNAEELSGETTPEEQYGNAHYAQQPGSAPDPQERHNEFDHAAAENDINSTSSEVEDISVEMEGVDEMSDEDGRTDTRDDEQARVDDSPQETAVSMYDNMSVTELATMAKKLRVDLTGCIERHEMIQQLVIHTPVASAQALEAWSTESLRVAAEKLALIAVGSNHYGRSKLIPLLVGESKTSPRAARFLATLAPLMDMNVSQLQSVARQEHVDTSFCVEKSDMIDCIVMARGPPSAIGSLQDFVFFGEESSF